MECKIEDIEGTFNGTIVENLGNNEYVIKLNDREQNLKILTMDSRGIEFVLDQKYHIAKYLESSTSQMNLVVDGVPISLNLHPNLDKIVYKNTGAGGPVGSELALRSQIPGKVVSIAVQEGASIKKSDIVCVLESMKMQVSVKSHKDGTVKKIKIKEGGSVAKNDVIAEIE
ncbi:MAG: acetyl-CoA carboxylase biotin carboxyl carrier protein subunit [Thaumarchaeota archaeon]|nr:MAG: biotin carboxyl carrier protein of acetyl-CoA/ propionyl-CoA carboxylase [Nitrosopumilales archaeon]MCZ6583696.1 acetyl-CoA carboxylase biotin carboxyl carrier protein subunit [Nitrososphaerota archaeon]